jgi:hypothetical protein
MEDLKQKILEAWDNRDLLQEKETIEAIRTVISKLDSCVVPNLLRKAGKSTNG